MERNHTHRPTGLQFGVAGAYLKRGLAIIVGIALAIAFYFFVIKDTKGQLGVQNATIMCVCPNCGTMLEKPKGMDCEEIHCPNCSHAMTTGAMLAANPGTSAGANPPLTQNQRETLAETGVLPPAERRLNLNQPVAGQNIALQPPPTEGAVGLGRTPAIAGGATEGPVGQKCVCPNCGKTIDRQPGVACPHVHCPNCGTLMTNPVYIGVTPTPRTGEMRLAGLHGTGRGNAGAATPCPHTQGTGTPYGQTVAAPCPRAGMGGATAAPCPGAGGHGGGHAAPCPGAGATGNQNLPSTSTHVQSPTTTGTATITYSANVRPILERNCYKCHSGPLRNLTTYDQVRPYADSGLLLMMTQPGGPMSRFLTADEFHTIRSWVNAGAPR